MTVPYLTVYTKAASGMGRGDYTTFHTQRTEVRLIQQSLNEGDRTVFNMWLGEREEELDRKRPIRFYTSDGTKLFDGQIINTKYLEVENNYKILEVTANGWWQELASMDFHQPIEYDETETPNSIFADLVRLANDMGVMKEAVYKYDTDRIPGYNTFETTYTTATGTTFTFSNVYEGLQTMTRFLDVAETLSPFEFGLRIETLPRTAEDCNADITVSDVETGIYILPFILDLDKTVTSTLQKDMLASGHTVRRDYRRLANDVLAVGDGVFTQQIRTDAILSQKDITSNDQSWTRDEQVLASHYLRVTIENPTGSDFAGWVQITRVSGVTNPTETFPMYVPSGGTQIHYTSDRTEDGLPTGDCVRAVDFNGGKITVNEITNDNTPYNTTIAGESINNYGLHPHRIDEIWLNTQMMADYAAGKHCRLYHAPTHVFDADVLRRHIEFTNLVGRTVDVYSPFVQGIEEFLVTDVVYSFEDTKIEQRLSGTKHNYDWSYDDTNIYVVDSIGNQVVSSTGAKVVI